MTRLIRPFTLALAMMFGLSLATASFAEASERASVSDCKKKKKKKKKRKKRKKRYSKSKKSMSVKTVLRMWKKGVPEKKIIAKAKKRGYKASAKDVKRLEKKYVSPSLIAALTAGKAPVAKRAKKADKAKLAKAQPTPARRVIKMEDVSPDEIDFDSVPPPKGSPSWVKNKQGSSRTVASASKKKTLDRSLRPAAPFDDNDRRPVATSDDDDAPQKRRVVVAN